MDPSQAREPGLPDQGVSPERRSPTPPAAAALAEEVLAQVWEGLSPEAEERALAAFSELLDDQREARAIALARALLGRVVGAQQLRVALAEAQVARADDAGAVDTLAPLLEAAEPAIEVLALAARALDRLGQESRATQLWQGVLARDVDYPGARSRAAPEVVAPSAGATLASGGELSGGRYLVRRELGRGGAGAVFEALDRDLGRPVALKIYHQRGAAARGRLRLEARTPARLEHPGVIRIFDLDEELGAIAMEWVRGRSLKAAARDEVAPASVRAWILSLVDALAFVHDAGFVHRDLKPSNVLLRRDGRAVLTDFGLALPLGESPARAGEGTRGFAAPEQLRAAPAHGSADVYALGALLLELLPAIPTSAPAVREIARACQALEPAQRPGLPQLVELLEAAFHGS
ncbi:MAG: serine/threonine protein kinase [Deltaproteobacteria bacterium]|nr:serine/threonine protein kinase [Deltaproteobacteria bacterium]